MGKVQVRRGDTPNWQQYNPVLAVGEPGYDMATKRFYIGDGVTPWVELPPLPSGDDLAAEASQRASADAGVQATSHGYTDQLRQDVTNGFLRLAPATSSPGMVYGIRGDGSSGLIAAPAGGGGGGGLSVSDNGLGGLSATPGGGGTGSSSLTDNGLGGISA